MLKKWSLFLGITATAMLAGENSAEAVKVNADSGVVVNIGEGGVRPLPSITVNNAAELPTSYILPPEAAQDFYQYAHQKNLSPSLKDALILPTTPNENALLSLSVLQAENFALAYSWQLKSQMEARRAARGKKLNAIGNALPSVDYSARYEVAQSYNDTQNFAGPERANFSQGPGVSQPLFRGGKIIAGIREANRFREQVEENILDTRLTVRNNIRSLYYSCLLSLKMTDVWRKQTQASHEYWQKTKKRFEAGDVPELDVLRYEVRYKLDEANYINYRNDYNVGITQLLRWMGQPLTANVMLNDPFEFDEFDPGNEEELTNYALENRPDLKSARLEEQIRNQQLKGAKGDLLPALDGVASFRQGTGWTGLQQDERTGRYAGNWNWSAGLQLSWGILSGLGQNVRGKIMQADAALVQAEFSTRDKIDQVRQDVRTAVLNILSANDWVKSQKENVKQAERVLQQENIKWEEGASDYLKILDAQKSLGDAQGSYWQGIYKYKTSIVSLEYALGRFYQTAENEVQGYQTTKVVAKKAVDENEMLSALAMPKFTASETFAADDGLPTTGVKIVKPNTYGDELVPAMIYEQRGDAWLEQLEMPELDGELAPVKSEKIGLGILGLPELE